MTEKGREEPEFYGVEDQEILTAVCPDEVMEETIEDLAFGPLPMNIEVLGFNRALIKPEEFTGPPLEQLLKSLNREYGNPDVPAPREPTRAMLDAQETFISAVLEEYDPWICRETQRETVDTCSWLQENPEWLDNARDGFLPPNTCPQCGKEDRTPLLTGSDGRPRCFNCTLTLRRLGRLR